MLGRSLIFLGVLVAATGGAALALWTGLPLPQTPGDTVDAAVGPGEAPQVVLEETEADLGVLDQVSECSHVFWIRNNGTAPLELQRGRTSCKCMMSVLPEKPIPPGGRAPISIGAKSSAKRGPFRHTAFVLTNDPQRKSFPLRITGVTRTYLGVSPGELSFALMEPGESSTGTAVVYSQVWGEFEIGEVRSSLDGMTWEIEPASDEALEELEARAGYLVRLVVPPGQPVGRFQEWLELSVVTPQGEAEGRSARIGVVGNVPPPIELFGRGLIDRRRLRLETVSSGKGLRHMLTLKIRDENRLLSVRRIETKPEFLRATLSPMRPEAPELGLYRIDIEVPPGSPSGAYQGDGAGQVSIETDHPAVPRIEFRVEMVVLTPQSGDTAEVIRGLSRK